MRPMGGLHVIVDLNRPDELEVVRDALAGGADIIQLRCKSGGLSEMREPARRVRAATEAAGKLLIVNDRLDLAMDIRADGVHLGPDDMPVSQARRLADPEFIVGASAGRVETARAAEAAGADYLGVGPVYMTTSKADARPVIGLDGLAAVCEAVTIPVFAIGGIDIDRLPAVMRTGAVGAAVISALAHAADVREAVAQMRQILSSRGVMNDAN